MARPRAKAPTRRATLDRLAAVQRVKLLCGSYFDFLDDERGLPRLEGEDQNLLYAGFDSLADMRRAWRKHRKALMVERLKDWPGTRPWGWWLFEHPEFLHGGKFAPDHRDQRAILAELGELAPDEDGQEGKRDRRGKGEIADSDEGGPF